jgi:hypothetical protein
MQGLENQLTELSQRTLQKLLPFEREYELLQFLECCAGIDIGKREITASGP